MLDSKGPEASIVNFRPVQHHCPGNQHHSLDAPFSDTIVMVCSNTSQLGNLGKVLQMDVIIS